ncbi:MAG: trypsin-like peptidase domain-containing protein [Ginsengibacter sp.]
MKKILCVLVLFFSLISFSYTQNLDGYKYVYIPTLKYVNGGLDIFGISELVRNSFIKKGFTVFDENNSSQEEEIKKNNCLLLNVTINHTANTSITVLYGKNTVTITLKNCLGEVVISGEGTCGAADYRLSNELQKGTKRALEKIFKNKYVFDEAKTPEIKYPSVERTNETEETIKNYLSSNKVDPIEGIYKSYQDGQLSYYKFGIIKKGNAFKAIIIESDIGQWKPGEVKAIFEQSSMKGIYSVKWYLGNKTPFETFGNMDNDALLSVELKDVKTDEKKAEKFIKMFPSVSGEIVSKNNTTKASGSGFFITTDGIIATNAHVIEDASNIQITVSNEVGIFNYKAKILLVDSKNDVALLQINDEKFKGLNSIPYGFAKNSDVGSKVFTIGYPLNDVMGNNYKVTDGIISSQSGIADDVRYYQISVPLQPGNSGGPLFNKDGNIIGITSARLNSKALGTQIENVNYAIKSSYLLNLYNMLPNSGKLSMTSQVVNKDLQDQIKVLKNYVCLIRVF